MANPPPYQRGYSFQGHQAANPDDPLPGTKVDQEFDSAAASTAALAAAIQDVRREDGALRNGIVTPESLEPNVRAMVDGTGVAAAAASAAAAAGSATAAEGFAEAAVIAAGGAQNSAEAAAGSAQDAADAAASIPAGLSDVTPQALGTAAPGTSGDVAREDHVHPALAATGIRIGADNALNLLATYTNWQDWTPAFSFATPGDLSVTYHERAGRWLRIGNKVLVVMYVDFTPAFTTAAGNARFSGLPVNSNNATGITGWRWPLTLARWSGSGNPAPDFPSGRTMVTPFVSAFNTIQFSAAGSGVDDILITDVRFTSGDRYIIAVGGAYEVASP